MLNISALVLSLLEQGSDDGRIFLSFNFVDDIQIVLVLQMQDVVARVSWVVVRVFWAVVRWQHKARQGKLIYISHFIHSGNSKCFT